MKPTRESILKQYKENLPDKVLGFFEYHRPLSNFHLEPFVWQGVTWPSSENAYQAAKGGPEYYQVFSKYSPNDSKKQGRMIPLIDNWNENRIVFMRDILIQKFHQCPIARNVLISTGNALLVEKNWWSDVFWGECDSYGENNLGKLLMEIRKLHA